MNSFTVQVIYPDGRVQQVWNVTHVQDRDRVLSLYRERPISGYREHLGSWPFESIQSWKVGEEL